MQDTFHLAFLVLHVLGAAVIIGGVFASLLILIKDRIPRENLEHVRYLWKFLTPAIGIQILTGILLAAGEWDEFGKSPLFWTKMVLLVVDGFFGGKVLGKMIKKELLKDDKQKELRIPGARRIIWFSFLTFMLIATLGVMLAESHAE